MFCMILRKWWAWQYRDFKLIVKKDLKKVRSFDVIKEFIYRFGKIWIISISPSLFQTFIDLSFKPNDFKKNNKKQW